MTPEPAFGALRARGPIRPEPRHDDVGVIAGAAVQGLDVRHLLAGDQHGIAAGRFEQHLAVGGEIALTVDERVGIEIDMKIDRNDPDRHGFAPSFEYHATMVAAAAAGVISPWVAPAFAKATAGKPADTAREARRIARAAKALLWRGVKIMTGPIFLPSARKVFRARPEQRP